MFKNHDIICFAGEDWWYHNPHSNLHIMKSFAANNRVLFVNSIGIRTPKLGKGSFFWKKVWGKLKSMLRYLRKAEKKYLCAYAGCIADSSGCRTASDQGQ